MYIQFALLGAKATNLASFMCESEALYCEVTSYNEYLVIGCKIGYAPVASSVDANSGVKFYTTTI